ncbi:MAG: hypothetical protein M1828_007204 [Chrysothrix sp. TS-e1954]|nr:MAG: hypothetical protein M1828_007204 [Chrysothrix sp. TS-e1954]
MKLTNASAVPVYTISGSSTARPLPEHLVRQRRRSQKKDPEHANRVELLQDFEFEESSSCIRISEDGEWVVSTGTYKPQIHVHYLPHLSLSFSRHTDSLNETFQLLSSDYSKSIHLQSDRRIDIHTAGGRHDWVRIPRYGRDLQWSKQSTEALVPAVGVDADGNGEVFRLNLELGRFLKSYAVGVGGDDTTTNGSTALQGGVNAGAVNVAAVAQDSHNLLAFGTSLGTVEFHDPRSRSRAGILLPTASNTVSSNPFAPGHAEISALQFHPQGLTFASGNSQGLIHLYDLRSPVPLLRKDQGYGFPIQTLTFLTSSSSSNRTSHLSSDPKILSADKRIIKIWDAASGAPWTSVEPAVDLHSVAWFPSSGMLLTANEGREQHSFFVPQLGPAPKWCSFLDNIVEEMAEDANDPSAYSGGAHQAGEVYDNYKFVTLPQLKALSLDHLVGKTGLLRPYMHGYFIDQNLYTEAQLISQPDLWQDARQKRIKERIEKERQSRIRGTDKKVVNVKVNKSLADRIQQQEAKREERNELRKARRALKKSEIGAEDDDAEEAAQRLAQEAAESARPSALTDSRFSRVFADEDFAVDEASREFQTLNAGGARQQQHANGSTAPGRRYTAAEEEQMSDVGRRNSLSSEDSASESDQYPATRRPQQDASNGDTKITSDSYVRTNAAKRRFNERAGQDARRKAQGPSMHVTKSASNGATRRNSQSRDRSFGSRLASLPIHDRTGGASRGSKAPLAGGEKSITFEPGSSKKDRPREGGLGAKRQGSSGGGRKDRRSASGNVLRRM